LKINNANYGLSSAVIGNVINLLAGRKAGTVGKPRRMKNKIKYQHGTEFGRRVPVTVQRLIGFFGTLTMT